MKSGSSNDSPRSRSIVRAYESRRTSSPGKAARARSSRVSAGRLVSLWPGCPATRIVSSCKAKCSFAALARPTWPTWGGSKAPPKRPVTGSAPLEHLVAQLDLVACARTRRLQDRLELLTHGRAARDAEAALGAEHAVRAPRRLWPVDEVVDELLVVAGCKRHDLIRWDELEERALQILDPGSGRGRHAEHAH